MRSNLGLATLALAILASAIALPARAESVLPVAAYSPAPRPPTMEALHADIEACRVAGCSLSPGDVERMAWWVARGNRLAIRLSFAAADMVDGDGALAQSYGHIIKQDPAAFLALARDEGAPALVVATDAATTPDLLASAQADELRARRNALEGVTDPSLAALRDQCVARIAARLAAVTPDLASAGT